MIVPAGTDIHVLIVREIHRKRFAMIFVKRLGFAFYCEKVNGCAIRAWYV